MGTISRTALAEKWGVSPSYIDNLVQAGKLVRVGRGVFDEEAAEKFRDGMSMPKRMAVQTVKASGGQAQSKQAEERIGTPTLEVHDGGQSDKREESPMVRARILREVMQAKTVELNYKERAGELVKVSDVKSTLHTIVRIFCQRSRALPIRIGPQIAVVTDPQECVEMVSAEIEILLSELQDALAEI